MRIRIVCCLMLVCGWGGAYFASPLVFGQSETFAFSEYDPQLQRALETTLEEAPFKKLIERRHLSVALVDLSDPGSVRYSGVHDDAMHYAASLPKIAILLGAFDQIEKGKLAYTPGLGERMEQMIRNSSNREATNLIKLVGFQNIAASLQDRDTQLYDPARNGGLWVGKDYGGGPGRWKRDPMYGISHAATARQVARFLVMLDQGNLVSSWASREMKQIMGKPGIEHKFVEGLAARPGSVIYRKSGTWKRWHADAVLVERSGKKYVAVALLESSSASGVLSRLILRLDDIIHNVTRP